MATTDAATAQNAARAELQRLLQMRANRNNAVTQDPTDTGVETGGTGVNLESSSYTYNRGPDVDRSLGLATVSKDTNTQYQVDVDYIKKAYDDGTISGTEYEARLEYLAKSYENGTYMSDRTGGVRDVGYEYTDWEDYNANPSPLDENGDLPTDNSTGLGTNAEDKNIVDVNDYISGHDDNGSRLLHFKHTDGSDDDQKVGYIKLLDTGGLMSSIAGGENKQNLDAIYSSLKSRYNKFVITSIQESRSERSAIMPTVGDSFAATFSGREPMVLAVSGLLVCDYDRSKLTWYHAFMNAYEYYLRASRLAKYRVRMKLVLPDFTEYTGYMLTIGSAITSDSDMVIPMNFSMLVCNEAFNKAFGLTTGVGGISTTTPSDSQTEDADTSDSTTADTTSNGSETVTADENKTAAGAEIAKTAGVSEAGAAANDTATVAVQNTPTAATTVYTQSQVSQVVTTRGSRTPSQAEYNSKRGATAIAQQIQQAKTSVTTILANGQRIISGLGARVKGGIQN